MAEHDERAEHDEHHSPHPDTVHDSPSMAQLVEAVREFLDRDVLPAVDGRVQFHTRVAVNVLGMVERELALHDEHRRRYREGLAALRLPVDSEADLVQLIRTMSPDDPRLDDIAAFVRQTVRAKLEVANPRHLASEPDP